MIMIALELSVVEEKSPLYVRLYSFFVRIRVAATPLHGCLRQTMMFCICQCDWQQYYVYAIVLAVVVLHAQ